MNARIIIFLLCASLPICCFGTNTDSIIALLNSDKEDSTKVNRLITLFNELTNKGDYANALQYATNGLKLAEKLGLKKQTAICYRNIGNIHGYTGNYPLAMENYFASLKLFENLNDKKGIAETNENIGINYMYQNNYDLALKQFTNSLKVHEQLKDADNVRASYNLIGTVLYYQNNCEEALTYFTKYLTACEQVKDLIGISNAYGNIANVYTKTEKHEFALEFYLKSLNISKDIRNKADISISYINISGMYRELKQYDNALKYADSALFTAKELGDKDGIKTTYETLSRIYYETTHYKEAYDNYKLYTQYSDSLINEESVKQIGDLKTDYAVKEKESQMKAAQEKQAAVLKTIIGSVLAGLLLVVVFAAFITRALRTTRKQKRIIEAQKELVQEKQKEITDSITYAKRLQEAILPPLELIRQLPGSFVFYQPKDIVAGDFYWAEQVGNNFYIAAADSTGHGVPGAMVSVVCSNALNRSVKEFGLTEPGKILDKTKELVVETFTKSNSEVKDGMDISLLRIEFPSRHPMFVEKSVEGGEGGACPQLVGEGELRLSWSGANNPLYYITPGSSELTEIKPDKQPIGKTEQAQPFTTHTLPYIAGTTYYLFTDGFPDQFGGDKEKKYSYKRFKELLLRLPTPPPHSAQKIPYRPNFRNGRAAWSKRMMLR